MCWKRGKSRRAFTLLEVVLAVMVLGMIAFSIYRFVEVTLTAIRVSTEKGSEDTAMQALMASLAAQITDLPTERLNALRGEAHKFNDKESDEMQWLGRAGNGLFTEAAAGEYNVTLALRPVPKTTLSELGLRRIPTDAIDQSEPHWLRLMGNVNALEIRYFDPRLNAWLEKWSDAKARPALVRIRILREGDAAPYESIIRLPMTPPLR